MQRQSPQPLEYASGQTAPKRRVTLTEVGICIGIVAITISMTAGSGEGREGYIIYLYPLVWPLLKFAFGSHEIPGLVLFIACALYWPVIGIVAHVILVQYSRWRHRRAAA